MNKWGFKPSKLYKSGTTIDNSNYIKSPTSNESVMIDNTKVANDENHKNTYTLALAAKVDGNTALDSYTQTFTLAATGNATEYHIAYVDANNNMPGITYGESTNGKAQITDVKPHKDGYVFGGWCTVSVLANQDCVAAGGTVIPANGELQLDAASANNRNLYAIWATGYDNFDAAFQNAGKDKVGSYYAMQDMTEDICRTIVIGSSGTLVDIRDNRTYAVSKYADNNCWMRQNLELTFYTDINGTGYASESNVAAASVANGVTVLNSNNTDITTGTTYSVSSFKATLNNKLSTPWSVNDGNSFSPSAYMAGLTYTISNGTQNQYGQNEYVNSDIGQPYERKGVLYSWSMATLGSGNNITTGEADTPDSICPKGWQLPLSIGDRSYYNLLKSYYAGSTIQGKQRENSTISSPSELMQLDNLIRRYPLNFVNTGAMYSGTSYGYTVNELGLWTARKIDGNGGMMITNGELINVAPTNTGNPNNGRAVRCVAR